MKKRFGLSLKGSKKPSSEEAFGKFFNKQENGAKNERNSRANEQEVSRVGRRGTEQSESPSQTPQTSTQALPSAVHKDTPPPGLYVVPEQLRKELLQLMPVFSNWENMEPIPEIPLMESLMEQNNKFSSTEVSEPVVKEKNDNHDMMDNNNDTNMSDNFDILGWIDLPLCSLDQRKQHEPVTFENSRDEEFKSDMQPGFSEVKVGDKQHSMLPTMDKGITLGSTKHEKEEVVLMEEEFDAIEAFSDEISDFDQGGLQGILTDIEPYLKQPGNVSSSKSLNPKLRDDRAVGLSEKSSTNAELDGGIGSTSIKGLDDYSETWDDVDDDILRFDLDSLTVVAENEPKVLKSVGGKTVVGNKMVMRKQFVDYSAGGPDGNGVGGGGSKSYCKGKASLGGADTKNNALDSKGSSITSPILICDDDEIGTEVECKKPITAQSRLGNYTSQGRPNTAASSTSRHSEFSQNIKNSRQKHVPSSFDKMKKKLQNVPSEKNNRNFPNEKVNRNFTSEKVNRNFPSEKVNRNFTSEKVNRNFTSEKVNRNFTSEKVNRNFTSEKVKYRNFPNEKVNRNFPNEKQPLASTSKCLSAGTKYIDIGSSSDNQGNSERCTMTEKTKNVLQKEFSSSFGTMEEKVNRKFSNEKVNRNLPSEKQPLASASKQSLSVSTKYINDGSTSSDTKDSDGRCTMTENDKMKGKCNRNFPSEKVVNRNLPSEKQPLPSASEHLSADTKYIDGSISRNTKDIDEQCGLYGDPLTAKGENLDAYMMDNIDADFDDQDLVSCCDHLMSPTIPVRENKSRPSSQSIGSSQVSRGVKRRLMVPPEGRTDKVGRRADDASDTIVVVSTGVAPSLGNTKNQDKSRPRECPICLEHFESRLSLHDIDQHISRCEQLMNDDDDDVLLW